METFLELLKVEQVQKTASEYLKDRVTLLMMRTLIGARNSPAKQAELESASEYLPHPFFFPSNHGTSLGHH